MRLSSLKKIVFPLLFLFVTVSSLFSQTNTVKTPTQTNWSFKNPFEQKVFIENKGQFDKQALNPLSTIYYSASTQGVELFFTNHGLTYRYNKRVLPTDESESKLKNKIGRILFNKKNKTETLEREDDLRFKVIPQFLAIEWIGANKNAELIAEDPVSNYFTYTYNCSRDKKTSIKALGFKKIIYKNLYPNIDLEYRMPLDSGGVEYSFIIHPGGDASQIQMKYMGAQSIKIKDGQNLEIMSSFGLFTDHAPIAYYADNKQTIPTGFKINNTLVHFALNELNTSASSKAANRTIIIDPWTATPTVANGKAFDIAYDSQGNVYIAGGPQEVAKYNSAGVLQWLFALPSSYYTDFSVDEVTSEVYMFDFSTYTQMDIHKIGTAGTQTGFGTAPIGQLEAWRAEFDRCNNQIIVASGSASGSAQAFTVDKTNLSNIITKDVLNEPDRCHDMALLAVDDDGTACYMLATHSACGNSALHDNEIVKSPLPNLVPSLLTINSGFTFSEVFYLSPGHYTPPALGGTSHGFNGMKVRGCYLYGYDGNTIKIWDKHSGALIQTITVGGNLFDSGGLDVDECGNIYAGNGNTIKVYNPSYSLTSTLNLNGTVYDLRLGQHNNVYACGDNFVQEIDLSANVIQLDATLSAAACNGCNGSAQVQLMCNNVASTFCTKYLWSTGDTTQAISNLCAGTYTVSVKSGCNTSYSDSVIITSGNPPNVVASADNSICIGASTTLSATGGVTYKWTPGNSLSDSTSATPVATPTVTTTYIVSGFAAGGCADKDTVVITVHPKPVLAKTVTNITCHGLCNGAITITPSIGTAPYTYNWTGGCTAAACTNLCQGSYTTTATDHWGCIATADTNITEPAALLISTTNFTPASCHGVCDGTATALATGGIQGTGYSYSWNTTPVQNIAAATALCAGSYTCTVTDSNNCTNSTTVTILEPPPMAIAPIPPVCAAGNTSLTAIASGGNGGYNYTWATPQNPAFATTASVIVNPATSITYTVIATDSKGCTSPPDTVGLFSLPIVIFGIDKNHGCVPLCVNFTDSSTVLSGTIVAWNWDFGDGSTHSTSQNPEHCYTAAGVYSVTLTVTSNNGCVAMLTKNNLITVYANPIAAFTPTPNPATVLDPSITFYNHSSQDVNYWNWNFGDGTSLAPSTSSPIHEFPKDSSNSYIVTLIVHNAGGCYDTVSHPITIDPEFTFFIPNSFTPNGDGINDYFYGSGVGIIKFNLSIFDRWGNLIFQGKELNDKWDGKANGGKDIAQIDVYVWKVKLTDIFNKPHDYIGTVTLVK